MSETKTSAEPKPDLRIQRTKDAIREAFKSLVMELPFEKITVKAIADRARINRNTFYLHYETVDDLLREIQSGYQTRYVETIKNLDYINDTGKLVRAFFDFMESSDEFFQKITCDSRFDYIRSRMQSKVMAHTKSKSPGLENYDEAVQNIIRAFNGTTLYLYRQWVFDGRKIPKEKMIELASTLLERGMKGLSANFTLSR